jgi:hypothetical protein
MHIEKSAESAMNPAALFGYRPSMRRSLSKVVVQEERREFVRKHRVGHNERLVWD